MAIRETQLMSWDAMQPKLGKRQRQIMEALKDLGNSATNRQLAKHLGWEINRVTGRINELCEMKKVLGNKTIKDPETNRMVTLWQKSAINNEQIQLPF